MFCNRCGVDNQTGAQFCRNCAASLVGNPQQNQQGQQNYQQPFQQGGNGYANPANAKASGKSITSLVLSIGSLFLCCLFLSVPGMIIGKMEMNAVREGRSPLASEGYAKAGFYIGLVVTILSIGFYIIRFFSTVSEIAARGN